jgi:glyoxylase-like metal-dependent hydrolase (beta-lactamase superfamily II)
MRVEEKLDFGPVQGIRIGYALMGKPLMTVICYQLDNILIDTGPANARRSLLALLDTRKLSDIYLTHYHEDHAGNAAYLQKHLDLDVRCSCLTASILAEKVRLRPYELYMWGGLATVQAKPVADNFFSDQYQFKVISTPGHSLDHVVYLEEKEGWLFSGDMYLGSRIKYFRKDEDVLQTIASLKKIACLNFDKLFCGHNPQLKQPVRAIERKIDYLENILGEVRQCHLSGVPEKELIKRLLKNKEYWPARIVTLGDVSYKNLLLSALKAVRQD